MLPCLDLPKPPRDCPSQNNFHRIFEILVFSWSLPLSRPPSKTHIHVDFNPESSALGRNSTLAFLKNEWMTKPVLWPKPEAKAKLSIRLPAKIIRICWSEYNKKGFHDSSVGKESTYNAGDLGWRPGLGRFPREGKDYPLQYSGLEKSTDCTVHGVTKTGHEWATFTFFFSGCLLSSPYSSVSAHIHM